MKAVCALLGVRTTTPASLCLLEGGLKPLGSMVKARQKKFFEKMVTARSEMTDDPLKHTINIPKELNKPIWSYIESLLNGGNFVNDKVNEIEESVKNANDSATKFQTYIYLNLGLELHPLYTNKNYSTPDYLRISFTRYMLRVEIGWWSRTPKSVHAGLVYKTSSTFFRVPLLKNILTHLQNHIQLQPSTSRTLTLMICTLSTKY